METKTIKGRIKLGAWMYQDHGFGRWPGCKPPSSEYTGEEYKEEARDPDMIFDCAWNGQRWECVAYGYGVIEAETVAARNGYGNGSIFLYEFDGVEAVTSVIVSPEAVVVALSNINTLSTTATANELAALLGTDARTIKSALTYPLRDKQVSVWYHDNTAEAEYKFVTLVPNPPVELEHFVCKCCRKSARWCCEGPNACCDKSCHRIRCDHCGMTYSLDNEEIHSAETAEDAREIVKSLYIG